MTSENVRNETRTGQRERPSHVYRLLQRRLKKKMGSPYEILTEMEKYLSWFIPIVSSIFFVIVAASVKTDLAATFKTHISSAIGFILFFLSLFLAILSRFCIFHFNKLRSDFAIRIDKLGMTFFKLGEQITERLENLGIDATQATEIESLPSEICKDELLNKGTDEFFDLITSGFPDILGKRFAKRVNAISDKKLRNELCDKEAAKHSRFWAMKSGWGRWGIVSFYLCNVLFIASLIAWFVYVLESWWG
jgi:hypothetical protein